ncbi:hypothetical protein N8J89_07990 [Crossiella sp. CA-258035]|uniref:hypothetical protein n=1 Tax=Crossiella sp. CA-258035 TaxID=2981138 RepID=UPI0024BCE47E|nr:hypothetical protein [Crossiella sp. CA-258035]WHT20995.1 hypothetical protein N8J89_07990 [Crossiella sp. CA-258035]
MTIDEFEPWLMQLLIASGDERIGEVRQFVGSGESSRRGVRVDCKDGATLYLMIVRTSPPERGAPGARSAA